MKGDYLILAVKNLRHRGIRSWLTLLGIFIGVATVVALISLGAGLKLAVGAQFGVSSTQVISVQAGGLGLTTGPPGTGVTNRLTLDDVRAIEGLSTVDIAIGRNIETFLLEYNDKIVINAGFGFNEGEKGKWDIEMQDLSAEKGRLLQEGDTGKTVLGNNYMHADKSGFDKAIEVGDKIKINNKSFQVVGFLNKKGSFIIDNAVGVTITDLETLADNEDYVDVISVKVKDSSLMERAKEEIEKLLRERRNVKIGKEDFEVSTPEATIATINNILTGVQIFIAIIASISIVIGAIGIVNTMTTSVLERKKEIGIMKAIGAKNSQIFMQFFIESGLLGFVGGLVGVTFGTLLGFAGMIWINSFIGSELALNIDFILVGSALFGSFIIGSIAGISPAMKAAKQNPVEALRG